MKYSGIIEDMTWSYSRVTTFESCPYQFFLSYIKELPSRQLFFSDYGSFIHRILEGVLSGDAECGDPLTLYLTKFQKEVSNGVTPKIRRSYFEDGISYLSSMEFPYSNLKQVEAKLNFTVDGIPFTGIVDCVVEDGGSLVVVDHKSRALKPRSSRGVPTHSDRELDRYLRQLYLYSAGIKQQFGKYPDRLEFNCFRTKTWISEPFREDAMEKTKKWITEMVSTIVDTEDWYPSMEYWKCRYLCDMNHHCEYYQMNKG